MAQYEPGPSSFDTDPSKLQHYVLDELRRLSEVLEGVENVQLVKQHVEPTKRVDGLLLRADGTNWNPGSGAGVYYWDGDASAWVFLGGP